MTLIKRALGIVKGFPLLHPAINRMAIKQECERTTARPRPFSLWSAEPLSDPTGAIGPVDDYTSWPSLTNKFFSGRHLPPADAASVASLPVETPFDWGTNTAGAVTALFARDGAMKTDRSSVLFMFFAQWFTDSILRVDPLDRRKNTSNHDIDLCQIYGLKEDTTRMLRTMVGGRLKSRLVGTDEYPPYLYDQDATGLVVRDEFAKLPYLAQLPVLYQGVPVERQLKFYATGLERGNSSIGYVALNTVFLREHNRIANALFAQHPDWNDERLFQTARNVNITLLLKLVVEDYINHIVGGDLFLLDTTFAEDQKWYRTNWIAIEFDLLYRWHSLVPDQLMVAGAAVPASIFRNNTGMLEQLGLASVLSAASAQSAGRIGLGNTPDFLMGAESESIRMSRAFRVRPYNDYRERFGLDRLTSFAQLTTDAALQAKLQALYGSIDAVEYVVGIFAEDHDASDNALFGDLLNCMVAYDAFTQIFTNPLVSRNIHNADTFTQWGLDLITNTKKIQDLVDRNVGGGAVASLGT